MNRRRTLLKTGLITGGASLAGIGASLYIVRQGEHRALAEILLQLLENRERAAILGRSLRAREGDLAGISLLQINAYLLQVLELEHAERAEIAPALLIERMHSRVQRDFSEENTVVASGWLLSRSEAHLCALAALMENT